MHSGRTARLALAAALLAGVASNARAAGVKKAFRLQPKQIPEVDRGRVVYVEGKSNAEGDRFYVEHLSLLQPVGIAVMTPDEGMDLEVGLSKYRWDEFERSASTRGKGEVTFQVRTQGELRIVVRSQEEGQPYFLMVWVGDEIRPEMPPLVVPSSQVKGADDSSSGWIWIVAVMAGLGLIAGGVIVWWRRR